MLSFYPRSCSMLFSTFFFFNDPATTEIYTLSLHDALPILAPQFPHCPTHPQQPFHRDCAERDQYFGLNRSEEHTSELQSRFDLVCRLLLEKKKKKQTQRSSQSSRESLSTMKSN